MAQSFYQDRVKKDQLFVMADLNFKLHGLPEMYDFGIKDVWWRQEKIALINSISESPHSLQPLLLLPLLLLLLLLLVLLLQQRIVDIFIV